MPTNTTRHVLDLIKRWTDMEGGGGKGNLKIKLIKKGNEANDETSF